MMGLFLITGGSACGKSQYGESAACKLGEQNKNGRLYYAAAMYPYDDESRDRIRRHQRMRDGKGFETIECHTDIGRLKDIIPAGSTVLIECMSNLLANELYLKQGALNDIVTAGDLREENSGMIWERIDKCITDPVIRLSEHAGSCIVITNDVFSDGNVYPSETEEYIRLLGYVNQKLSDSAERVVRVVSSIPVVLKAKDA